MSAGRSRKDQSWFCLGEERLRPGRQQVVAEALYPGFDVPIVLVGAVRAPHLILVIVAEAEAIRPLEERHGVHTIGLAGLPHQIELPPDPSNPCHASVFPMSILLEVVHA